MPLIAAVLTELLAPDELLTAELVPEQLLGPYALLVAALLVVAVLWRALVGSQKDVVALSLTAGRVPDLVTRAEKAEGLLDVAVTGWREQTAASTKAADAIEIVATQLEVRPAVRRR